MNELPIIETPSPNFDERSLPVTMLVLHYTGMPDAASAINWLANPESKVSAHYVVTEDGQIIRMVEQAQGSKLPIQALVDKGAKIPGIEITERVATVVKRK